MAAVTPDSIDRNDQPVSVPVMRARDSLRRVRFVAVLALLGSCVDQAPNIPPPAAFTVACVDVTCRLTNASTDPDGTIDRYTWDFGDGGRSTTRDPVYTYAAPGGQFTIRLTVTDDAGDTATASQSVSVLANAAPVADFVFACTNLTCTFTDHSRDPNAGDSVVARAWAFGDGQTSTARDPMHSYAQPGGQFTVTLTVTDTKGATATAARPLVVSGNIAPVANFAVFCPGLTCTFTDLSHDPDSGDAPMSYTWSFGDGRSSTERSPTHTYVHPGGQFTVSLQVTDTGGASGMMARQITVTPDPAPDRSGVYARETPHRDAGRHTRYEIRNDGTFELRDWIGTDTTVYTGQWEFGRYWLGLPIAPQETAILLDFDGYEDNSGCGPEAVASFPIDGHIAIAYCGAMLQAGLEEGAYSRLPGPGALGPPPQMGQIAFVRDGRIHLANTDGGGVAPLTSGPNDGQPAWSPDGTRIAFTRRNGTTSALFVMDADGGNVTQRAAGGSQPSWSPDSQWIAFTCFGAFGSGQDICKVKAIDDGSSPINLSLLGGRTIGFEAYPTWSPDGARIAYTSDWELFDIVFDIWVIDPDGSNHATLTPHTPAVVNPYESWQPAWSPDGQRIAFMRCAWASTYCSANAISVISVAGGEVTSLVMATGFARPTWSPDGQVIAYASANTIEWVSADGQLRGRILENGRDPAWRP